MSTPVPVGAGASAVAPVVEVSARDRAWLRRTPRREAHPATGHEVSVADTPARVALRSVTFVVLFWWLATGAIFGLERSEATRELGLVLAAVLAGVGVWLLVRSRDQASAASARWSFLGGAFLWTFAQVAFYGGWVVGPEAFSSYVPSQPPSWAFATQAVLAMFWYQLLMLAALGTAWWIVRGRINRTGWWGLVVFWTSHQLACINVFLGVDNPGRGFFPDALRFLESYFGPSYNSWFLPVSIGVMLTLTCFTTVRTLRATMPMRRQAMALLTVLGALGVIELMVLGLPVKLELWNAFLEYRGY